MSNLKNRGFLFLKGIAMGAADVVPGVSGGTIAFISGIYEELIRSIRSIDHLAVKTLFRKGIPSFWTHINGWFLLVLLSGIAVSILSLSKVIVHQLETNPQLVWSFFFGLVVASAIYVGSTIKQKNIYTLLAGLAGVAVAYLITIASPTEGPDGGWYVFLTGSIAICAMILPGISGSFILLLMGMYEKVLTALHEMEIVTILLFMGGAGVGIITFSHILSWLLKKYHDLTIAVLAGFMIGSLNKVWPWKEVIDSVVIEGEEKVLKEANLLPHVFTEKTGEPHQLFACLALMVFGFILIYSLERLSGRKSKSV